MRRLFSKAVFILATVLGAAALASPTGSATGYVYDKDLSWWAVNTLEVASQHTGSGEKAIPYRTYVRCYANATSFEAPLLREGVARNEVKATIAYFAGQGIINIRNGTCRRARQFTEQAIITTETASAMSTVLHETLHRQGVRDERMTECFANEAVKYAGWLAHWNSLARQDDATWTASEAKATRARDLAFAASKRWIAREYLLPRAECLRLTRAYSWAEYRRPS